jgi:serine/threonine-protein kinase
VQIGLDLSSALSFAHRQRIVHRDVKPANVLHAGDNRWKLADFGIARLPDSDLTQVGIFMGTPGYSPPEAIREGRYTPQADVFAWGAVLYEVLSGRIPYEGPDTKTTNGYVVQGNALPPTRHDPSIPELISNVIMTALQPSDKQRYKDASEAEGALRDAWERCLTQALVHPSVLAMEEMSHDKAPARMHDGRSGGSARMPLSAPPPTNPVIEEVTDPEPHVIESKKKPNRFSDDDPTMLHVRSDESKLRPEPTSRGVGAVSSSGRSSSPPQGSSAVEVKTDRTKPIGQNVADRNKRSSATLIVLSILFALTAGFAALYYAGVIRL